MKHMLLGMSVLGAMAFGGAVSAQAEMTAYGEMPAGVYDLDETHAQLVWQVSHMGLSNYTARFTDFDAALTFDPKNPEKSTLVASVNPMSIKTDYPNADKKDFDAELSTGEQWLNAGEFADIKFESTGIKLTGENTGTMTGVLDFMGVEKPLSLDVTFNGAMAEHPFSKKPILGFSATGTLTRSEWGLSTHLPMIGDDVKLIIEAEFIKGE